MHRSIWTTTHALAIGLLWSTAGAFAADPLDPVRNELKSAQPEVVIRGLEHAVTAGTNAAPLIADIAAHLSSMEVAVRQEAAFALADLGVTAAPAAPALAKLLDSADEVSQYAGLIALRQIGPAGAQAEAGIARLVGSPNPMVAAEAAATAIALDLKSREGATDRLIAVLGDPNASIRGTAVHWLGHSGSGAVAKLSAIVQNGPAEARLGALDALTHLGPVASAAIPAIAELDVSTQPLLAGSVAAALGSIASQPDRSLPALVKLTRHPAPAVRARSLAAIGRFGAAAESSVPTLVQGLGDADPVVRLAALDALAALGPIARSAVKAVDAHFEDPIGAVTIRAAETLGKLGPDAVPLLIARLKSPAYALLTVETLDGMGPVAKNAVPTLVGMIQDPRAPLAREVCLALASLGADPKVAGPPLKAILADQGNPVRPAATFALGAIGDRSAIKDITNVLEDSDVRVRLASAWALLQLDPGNPEHVRIALPRLAEALQSPIVRVRAEVARTLTALGDKAAPALPALITALNEDDNPQLRMAYAMAIASIGPAAEKAVPHLVALAKDGSPESRRGAIFALGQLGVADASVKEYLLQQLVVAEDRDRLLAAWALLHMQPNAAEVQKAVPVVLDGMTRETPEIVVELIHGVRMLPTLTPEVKDALQRQTRSDDPAVRAAANAALDQLVLNAPK